MKLGPRTFQIYWDAHAWAGVVSALLVYVMFFMGAFALFRHELDAWANPAPAEQAAPAAAPALGPLLEALDREEPLLGKDRVAFLPEAGGLRAYWHDGYEHYEFRHAHASGRLEPLRSELGGFLYAMHYLGPIPNGIYVAGVAALALLLALVTGVLLHLKDVVRQWFQFRPERPARTWSSDMHKVLGIFGLPYQLLYAWTGAVLSLSYATIEPTFVATWLRGDAAAMSSLRGDGGEPPEPSGRLVGGLPPIDALVARARREVPELVPNWIGIEHVGDERSSVSVYGDVPGVAFGSASVMLNAADGAVLGVQRADRANALVRFEAWFYGLHYARFGGAAVKLLYALLALASCAVIVTGNLIWLERRDARRARRGNRQLERLTAGWCAGLVAATAALFFSSRLLAAVDAGSARVEQAVFWAVWALAFAAPFLWRQSRRVSAVELWVSAALLAAALGVDLTGGVAALREPGRAGVNAALLCLALVCGASGARLWRPPAQKAGAAPSLEPLGSLAEAE